jgi:hypothetical protein
MNQLSAMVFIVGITPEQPNSYIFKHLLLIVLMTENDPPSGFGH